MKKIKKLAFGLMGAAVLTFGFTSCSNEDSQGMSGTEESTTNSILSTNSASSIGELHNEGLDEMYYYLSSLRDLNSSNVNSYSENFLMRNQGPQAAEYYNRAINLYDFSRDLPSEFNLEIRNLNAELDRSDFRDLSGFKSFMKEYRTRYISSSRNLEVWANYKDVFVHSFEYWSTNMQNWERLNPNYATSSQNGCTGGWWKRAWCNVKKYVGVDSGAAASYLLIGVITGGPIGIGAGAGASLGASGAAIVRDIF